MSGGTRDDSARTPRRIVVVGAGAAGLMAAIVAASEGAAVTLLERTRDGGRKILISGGGRCNILPARLDERRFVTDSSPNTLKKILRSWPLREQAGFFETELGLTLEEEVATGKLFPSTHRARTVRDGLVALAVRRGVRFRPDTRVIDLRPAGRGWHVLLEAGGPLETEAVIMATGGLSVPTTGSDGTGLSIVERLGHTVHPTYPALTPITETPASLAGLAGISLTVTLTARSETRSATATGGFLFTHRGYSGPAVLDVSHVLVRARQEGQPARLSVQWTRHGPAEWESLLRADGARSVTGLLRQELPDRLVPVLLARAGVPADRTLAQLRRDERHGLVRTLVDGDLPWNGDEGYRKAEVTGGGVSLAEVDPGTLESRRHPGLYLCGEILDAFGPIGGYNFCWAWATGRAAGRAAALGTTG